MKKMTIKSFEQQTIEEALESITTYRRRIEIRPTSAERYQQNLNRAIEILTHLESGGEVEIH